MMVTITSLLPLRLFCLLIHAAASREWGGGGGEGNLVNPKPRHRRRRHDKKGKLFKNQYGKSWIESGSAYFEDGIFLKD
jgi:hypothetical protein